jgi:hypothetical protein
VNGEQPSVSNERRAMTASGESQDLLEWRIWLVAQRPSKAIGAAAIMVAGALLTAIGTGKLVLGLVALVLLWLATREFFLPVHYRLTKDGAWAEGFMSSYFIPWVRVKACHVGKEGLKLSPFGRKNRFEPFRGVYLRFAGNKEEVVEIVSNLAREKQTQ